MVLEDCNTSMIDKDTIQQNEKLKYATLLSLSLKIVSDINITGSKIIDSMLISSHSYLFDSYCSINKITTIFEDWTEHLYSKIHLYAFSNREIPNYPNTILEYTDKLTGKLDIRIHNEEYNYILKDIYLLTIQYLKDRLVLSLPPKDNGDFEITTSQIGKVVVNSLRLFGIFVMSIDRIYQYYRKDYGKPILILNSVLIGKDKFKYVKDFIDLIKKDIPECNELLIYADEQLLNKEDLLSCQIDELINYLKKDYPNLKLESLHI